MTQLSSRATTWFKVGFPAVWLGGFGLGTIVILFNSGRENMPPAFPIIFPAIWLLGLGLCAFICLPLKHVALAGSTLRVRGMKAEIDIPLSEVISASGSFMQNPETITLRLRHATILGSEIKFMPSQRFIKFTAHPTLHLLRDLIEKEASAAPPPIPQARAGSC